MTLIQVGIPVLQNDPSSTNYITGGLGPGNTLVLGGMGGNIIQQLPTRKVKGTRSVPGYWGGDPHRRILAERTIDRTRAWMQDHIRAGGIPADLWLAVTSYAGQTRLAGVTDHQPGTIECSCFKKTAKHADRKCKSCYGQRFIPGFVKFGYRTYFMSAIDPNLTLNNLEIDRTFTPNRLKLNDNAITGTAETVDFYFDHDSTDGSVWESEAVTIVDDSNQSSVRVEFSTDSGSTWYYLHQLGDRNPTGPGNIRFRITFTRDTINVLTPMFEIMRARYPRIERGIDGRSGPFILALKTITPHQSQKKLHGITEERSGMRYWTSPLRFFDPTIQLWSREEAIKDNSFIEFLEGQEVGNRFAITEWNASDPLARMTRQYFNLRQAQENEFYSLVF